MIYRPQYFRSKSYKRSIQVIEQNPLATVVAASTVDPEIALIPVLINQEQHQLEGHFARQNNIWRNFQKSNVATFLFQGPHGYISPAWYVTSPHLPTWNYAVVEVKAEVILVEDQELTVELLNKFTKNFDRNFSLFNKSEQYLELIKRAAEGIICFQAKIKSVNAKFKLSQNKQSSDVEKLIATLRIRGTSTDEKLADLMEQELNDQQKIG